MLIYRVRNVRTNKTYYYQSKATAMDAMEELLYQGQDVRWCAFDTVQYPGQYRLLDVEFERKRRELLAQEPEEEDEE